MISASGVLNHPATSSTPFTVLIADDDRINRMVLHTMLKKDGHTVYVAENGQEAVTLFEQHQPDLVLMDVMMPYMDGYEATRRLRQFSSADKAASSAAVHIIAMTANTMEGDRELCLTAGMDDYIAKPMRMEELQVALEKVVLQRAA